MCTISALYARNPDGTKGELLLQYPMPGKTGNLGRGNIIYFGQWSLDMSQQVVQSQTNPGVSRSAWMPRTS